MRSIAKIMAVVMVLPGAGGAARAAGWDGFYQSDDDGAWVAQNSGIVISHGTLRVGDETYGSEICPGDFHIAWPDPKAIRAAASSLLPKDAAASLLKALPKVAGATGAVVVSCEQPGGWSGLIGLFSPASFALATIGEGEGDGAPKARLGLYQRKP